MHNQWKERFERNRREAERAQENTGGHKDIKKGERGKLLGANQKKTSNSQGDGTDGGEKEGKEDENIEMLDKGAVKVKEGTT